MEFFLEDLNRAVIQQELFNFHEMPQLYMTLYPAVATSNKGSDRTKDNDVNTIIWNGGGSSGGLGGSNTGGHDLCNSCLQGRDLQQTKMRVPIKIRVFSSVTKCRFSNPPQT